MKVATREDYCLDANKTRTTLLEIRAIDAEHYWISARFERRDGWDANAYPFNLPVVRNLDELVFHPKVTFLVGENGSGKSTLRRASVA